jgi:hypothetical protein
MIVDIYDFLITLLFIKFMICVELHVTRFHVFPKSFKEVCREFVNDVIIEKLEHVHNIKRDKKHQIVIVP